MKILFVNGSRGEWGYIKPVIDQCINRGIEYTICATNMLLLPQHGMLIDNIRSEGYDVSEEIYMSLEGHTHYSMAKSLGIFLSSFVDVLLRQRPDWVMLAGDRGEQFMAAVACSYTYTPVAHIQAGEKSGNIDGVVRHSIGKLVHIHFPANDEAAERLTKLGEQEFRIKMVGAPQLDELVNSTIPSLSETLNHLDLPQFEKFLLVVLHPVTEEIHKVSEQMTELLAALDSFKLPKVWIYPNNDAGAYSILNSLLHKRDILIHCLDNVPRNYYLSLLKYCDAIVGNSSSGILEAPTFKTPAVNIGRRQYSRVQGLNVINCDFDAQQIVDAIRYATGLDFAKSLQESTNPYGDGKSASRILNAILSTSIDDKLLVKDLVY
jgi:GDP/UDP-N,N'-diacetylbacillosamine 2-epimerase (hydrolysing)